LVLNIVIRMEILFHVSLILVTFYTRISAYFVLKIVLFAKILMFAKLVNSDFHYHRAENVKVFVVKVSIWIYQDHVKIV
jgi:hypothetical protein